MERCRGFTFIEVMIVLAIVALLAAIAWPSYAGYITRTRRIEGQLALLEAMQQQERFYTRNNTYLAFSSDSTDASAEHFKRWSGSAAASSAYELRARACPGRVIGECVEMQAVPGTDKVDARFKDPECATLTLNSAGVHASSGTAQRCWP